jgi:hypothetical protein
MLTLHFDGCLRHSIAGPPPASRRGLYRLRGGWLREEVVLATPVDRGQLSLVSLLAHSTARSVALNVETASACTAASFSIPLDGVILESHPAPCRR